MPSFHFVMAVDPIPELAIKKMQAALKIKWWLNLARCFITSALHHQNVINIPSLTYLRTKAKLTFLSSISTSQDPLIEEISRIFTDEEYCKNQRSNQSSVGLLLEAKNFNFNYFLYIVEQPLQKGTKRKDV